MQHIPQDSRSLAPRLLASSGAARSQMTPGHGTHFFFWLGGGWVQGHAPLVNFCILEVATQIVFETIFEEMPSVLNQE